MSLREYELGEKVIAASTITRRREPPNRRRWVRVADMRAEIGLPVEPVSGVIVGWRTLSDGRVDFGYYDEPSEYMPTRHFKAYLVAFDMREKPLYVLPEDLTRRGETDE